jgi:signal-transduction protein with cAMP-binding, CBS, and nucleotidyltransferase domain
MVQNSAAKAIAPDCLMQVLGEELATPDLDRLQASVEMLVVVPGTSFWHATEAPAGIYIILAGKVRLFDLQDDLRLATLTVGKSFGASTLFPTADFSPYLAKAALVVGGVEISIGYLPSTAIYALWERYPQIQTHLRQQAEQLEAIVTGTRTPAASFSSDSIAAAECSSRSLAIPHNSSRSTHRRLFSDSYPKNGAVVAQSYAHLSILRPT